MKLEILHVPECPNLPVLTARLDEALAGHRDVVIDRHEISEQTEAASRQMTGSPTLLVNGADPFALPGQAPSLSCRLYVDDAGTVSGAPSLSQPRAAPSNGTGR